MPNPESDALNEPRLSLEVTKSSGFAPVPNGPAATVEQIQAERKALLASLHGKQVRTPDLRPLFEHWPTGRNKHLEQLKCEIGSWVEWIHAEDDRTILDHKASDFSLFAATWWPNASLERLRVVAKLVVWLYAWDDSIDESPGALWSTFAGAQQYRAETLEYVRWSLGLEPGKFPPKSPPPTTNRTILCFEPVGTAMREAYSPAKCAFLLKEIVFISECQEKEQRQRLEGKVLNVEAYWQYRWGSSAVWVVNMFGEFANEKYDKEKEEALPDCFYEDEDVRMVMRCSNALVSSVNDVLSLRREVKYGSIDSLIPLVFFQTGDIQCATDRVVSSIKDWIREMDKVETKLLAKYNHAGMVRRFIDACKHNCTGNLAWSLETRRYGVEHLRNEKEQWILEL